MINQKLLCLAWLLAFPFADSFWVRRVRSGEKPLPTYQIPDMGTLNVLRLAAVEMLKNVPNEHGERGVVINTSSGAAYEGQIGQAAYSASKAAVIGMTLPIAREFADYGIRIVTIAPGIFDTPMLGGMPENVRQSLIKTCIFPKRMGLPEEYALLAKQIIQNPMLNGASIRLDGALRLAPR